MKVEEFNTNTPRHLTAIVRSGAPQHVTRHRKPWVTVVPTPVFDALLAAAGDEGEHILAAYRAATDDSGDDQETEGAVA